MSYFIIQNEETKGPYTIGQLRAMWNSGAVTGDTLYCEEGYEEWLHLRVLADELEPPAPVSQYAGVARQPSIVRVKATKSRGVYIILGLFFGLLGIHNFYAGHNRAGALQLIITLLLGWVIIGLIVSGLWALIDICTVTKDGEGHRMT